jgi:RimJ/RimL family protein N-acetyltransferase
MNGKLNGTNLLRGRSIRLVSDDVDATVKAWSRWSRDTLFHRLLDSGPPVLYSDKARKEYLEKLEESPSAFLFNIHTLEDDRLIGFIELVHILWNNGDAWVGLGIGARSDWNKGYGSEALGLVVRLAFEELNLHRVSLGVFAHNLRAIRAYEKVGFRIEGRERGTVIREGERSDDLYMGILRHEWVAQREA